MLHRLERMDGRMIVQEMLVALSVFKVRVI